MANCYFCLFPVKLIFASSSLCLESRLLAWCFVFSLDPSYVKAYHRRASARTALKRVSEALEDFEKVLQLEPKNKTAKMEFDKLKLQLREKQVWFICPFYKFYPFIYSILPILSLSFLPSLSPFFPSSFLPFFLTHQTLVLALRPVP